MAFIRYVPEDEIPPADRVPHQDNIVRIHGVRSRTTSERRRSAHKTE